MALSKEEIALELIKSSGLLPKCAGASNIMEDKNKDSFAKNAVSLYISVLNELKAQGEKEA